MRKLTKIVAPALIAAMGLGVAIQAEAQPAGNYRHDARGHTPARNANIRTEINGLNRDIDRAFARRTISNREASSLKREALQVQRLYGAYARNGLSGGEMRTLRARIDRIHVALRAERRDRDNRRG